MRVILPMLMCILICTCAEVSDDPYGEIVNQSYEIDKNFGEGSVVQVKTAVLPSSGAGIKIKATFDNPAKEIQTIVMTSKNTQKLTRFFLKNKGKYQLKITGPSSMNVTITTELNYQNSTEEIFNAINRSYPNIVEKVEVEKLSNDSAECNYTIYYQPNVGNEYNIEIGYTHNLIGKHPKVLFENIDATPISGYFMIEYNNSRSSLISYNSSLDVIAESLVSVGISEFKLRDKNINSKYPYYDRYIEIEYDLPKSYEKNNNRPEFRLINNLNEDNYIFLCHSGRNDSDICNKLNTTDGSSLEGQFLFTSLNKTVEIPVNATEEELNEILTNLYNETTSISIWNYKPNIFNGYIFLIL